MADTAMRTWALKGAEQRLLEIGEEAAAIYASFPELRDRSNGTGAIGRRKRGRPRKTQTVSPAAGSRGKRTMSADARRRISEAQKARWARQKANGQAGRTEAAAEPPAPRRKGSRKKK